VVFEPGVFLQIDIKVKNLIELFSGGRSLHAGYLTNNANFYCIRRVLTKFNNWLSRAIAQWYQANSLGKEDAAQRRRYHATVPWAPVK
jgi:hypothetical protein